MDEADRAIVRGLSLRLDQSFRTLTDTTIDLNRRLQACSREMQKLRQDLAEHWHSRSGLPMTGQPDPDAIAS